MRLSSLAFEPERARIVSFALICVILSIGHASENLILGGGVAAAKAGEVRPDLAVAIILNGIVYVSAITAFSWRMSANVLRAAMRGRRRLLDTLLGHDLATLERIDRDRLLHGLTGAALALTSHGPILVRITESVLVAAGAIVVLSFMSLPLLLIFAGVLSLVACGLSVNHRPVMGAYADANRRDAESHRDLVALVDGFKELKQNADRRQRFLDQVRARSLLARRARGRANRRLTYNLLLQGGAIMSTCGAFIFVLPHFVPELGHGTLIAATLMVANMRLMTVRDMPLLARGEAVVEEMEGLYETFGSPAEAEQVGEQPDFGSITLDAVSYHYDPGPHYSDIETGFALGPVSLHCPAGSITFIVGGNGSGKSTLLKLLAGLYAPSGGRALLNGEPVPLSMLREASSTIFADLHLFDRLYGMQDADPVPINAAIADMGIAGSTRLVDGAFTNISLSSGQRKRLAWVVAMQEARPLLLLDEWAADQDPEFRERFYRTLLPELRAAGRTVVAVSHDDRYFDVADQVVRLDFGTIRQG